MGLIDIGANLTNPRFSEDLEEVLAESKKQGVSAIIVTGTDLKKSNNAADLVRKYKDKYTLYSTAGIHPHQARFFNKKRDINRLRLAIFRDRVVALGECGLDFARDFSPKDKQLVCFEEQLKLAIEKKKNIFLHERDAYTEMTELLDKYTTEIAESGIKIVVHCFTGNLDEAKGYLERGLYFGLTGFLCDNRRNAKTLEALKEIPLDRIMVETDAPFMTPSQVRTSRNTPGNLGFVVQKIAQVKETTFETVSATVQETTCSFFGIETPAEPESSWTPPPVEERPQRQHREHRERRGGAGRGNFGERPGGFRARRDDRGSGGFGRGRGNFNRNDRRGNGRRENLGHLQRPKAPPAPTYVYKEEDFPLLGQDSYYKNGEAPKPPSVPLTGNWRALFP